MTIIFPNLSPSQPIVIDTETTGLTWGDVIVGFVLTWGNSLEQSLYYPIRHTGGNNIENPEKIISYFKELLEIQKHVIFHNGAFDLEMLYKEDIHVKGFIEDTQINAALIDELQLGGFSLENCCEIYNLPVKKSVGIYQYLASKYGGAPSKKQMGNYHYLPGDDPIGVEYARLDGCSTFALWERQQIDLDEVISAKGNRRKVWKVECDLIPILHRAKMKGVKIDEEKLHKVKKHVEIMTNEALKEVNNINVRSPKQVKEYVLNYVDPEDVPKTPKGNMSFKEDYLSTFEAGKKILAVRELRTLINMFIDPFINRFIRNGRVHPSFSQTFNDEKGTISGRLSCFNPNLQQITKRKYIIAALLRQIFLSDLYFTWYERDYDQAEYRLFADYANIDRLIKGYNDGTTDIHTWVSELLNIERVKAKNVNFGSIYGIGIANLANLLGIPLGEARALRKILYAQVPEANPYSSNSFSYQAQKVMEEKGFVRTIMGRVKHLERFPNGALNLDKAYRAIAYIIQGSCADCLKRKMVEVDNYFQSECKGDADFLFSVHDAINYQIRSVNNESKIDNEVKRIMESFGQEDYITLRVKMTTQVASGPNWGVATFGEDKFNQYLTEANFVS